MNDHWQIKHRLSKEEQEGMSNLLARLKELRERATKAQQEDVKNRTGVRREGYIPVLDYSK